MSEFYDNPVESDPSERYRNMTYYEILEVGEDATYEEIRHSFKRLSSENHPDHGGDLIYSQYLGEAWFELRDVDRRARYDAKISARRKQNKDSEWDDLRAEQAYWESSYAKQGSQSGNGSQSDKTEERDKEPWEAVVEGLDSYQPSGDMFSDADFYFKMHGVNPEADLPPQYADAFVSRCVSKTLEYFISRRDQVKEEIARIADSDSPIPSWMEKLKRAEMNFLEKYLAAFGGKPGQVQPEQFEEVAGDDDDDSDDEPEKKRVKKADNNLPLEKVNNLPDAEFLNVHSETERVIRRKSYVTFDEIVSGLKPYIEQNKPWTPEAVIRSLGVLRRFAPNTDAGETMYQVLTLLGTYRETEVPFPEKTSKGWPLEKPILLQTYKIIQDHIVADIAKKSA